MILFITEQPYSYNLNGAAALSSSHLRFIAKKFPGEAVRIVFLSRSEHFWLEEPDFDRSKIAATPIHFPEGTFRKLGAGSLRLFCSKEIRALAGGIFCSDRETQGGLAKLDEVLARSHDARFIWCEHLMPALHAFLVLPEESFRAKVIYSHHDFLFKILRIKSTSFRQTIRSLLVRRLEMALLAKVTSFVSGSRSESVEIMKFAPRARQVLFLPCLYPSLRAGELRPAGSGVRICHLGTAAATANKVGLRFFFERIFPSIEHLPVSIEFFGNVKAYILQEFPRLENHPKIVFHGFVPNLCEKIEEGMIHIIPYSGMTGTRTRVAGIARFKPCLLGFRTIQDSYPFLVSGENAMIADTEDDFLVKLKELIFNETLRRKISGNILRDMADFESQMLTKANITDRQ